MKKPSQETKEKQTKNLIMYFYTYIDCLLTHKKKNKKKQKKPTFKKGSIPRGINPVTPLKQGKRA